jgi:hypothetical protein
MTVTEESRRLTQSDMVLVSLAKAAGGTTRKVPYEELVLQAWRDFPGAFSLRNHPEFPDASDVHKKLYGTLKSEGFIVALGDKVFRLTDKGVARAAQLIPAIASEGDPVRERARLSREQRNFVDHALRSRVFEAWKQGKSDQLVDYDARVFFQFSIGTSPKDRKRKVEFARESIAAARDIGIEASEDLARLAEFLVSSFGSLLNGG